MPTSGDTNTQFTFLIVYRGTGTPSVQNLMLDSATNKMSYAGVAPMGARCTSSTRSSPRAPTSTGSAPGRDQTLRAPGPTDNDWYTSPEVKQAPSCTISGVITVNGSGLPKVNVKLTKSGSPAVTTGTNSQGRFTAKNLSPGTWTVTPTKSGYEMNPPYKNIIVPARQDGL